MSVMDLFHLKVDFITLSTQPVYFLKKKKEEMSVSPDVGRVPINTCRRWYKEKEEGWGAGEKKRERQG